MTVSPQPERLGRLCAWCAAVAAVLTAVVVARGVPSTPLNSFLDGLRFVTAVLAAMCATILVIERRVVARAASDAPRARDTLVIDLRDRPTRPDAGQVRHTDDVALGAPR